MSLLMTPLVCMIVFGAIYLVFELYARRSERKMLISKITEIHADDVSKVFAPYLSGLLSGTTKGKKSYTTLRWGLVLLGIGLGLLVAFHINYYYAPKSYEMREIIYFSSVCLFGGLALVISYLIERSEEKKD